MREALLHTKPEAPSVSGGSVRALVSLLVEVEKRLRDGPFDEWDLVVLQQWKVIVDRRLQHALTEVDRLLYPDRDLSGGYEIVEEAVR
jgi:hypothetical protein